MTLDVAVRHALGAFELNLAFTTTSGITALFGRSGSGKSSLIKILAGLMQPDQGHIRLDGEEILNTRSGRVVPAHRRRFGTVFQEARLFPHLSVRHNLLYGRWFAGQRRDPQEFDRIVALLGIGDLLQRAPVHLSGGEKQRVAIGRALLARPRLLLMDEPLAALDEGRKSEILPYLERLRDETKIPILYVSHAVGEVMRLAGEVLLIEDGRLVASGPVAEVLSLPDSSGLVGQRDAGTVLDGVVARDQPDRRIAIVTAGTLTLRLPAARLQPGQRLRVRIAARDILVATRRPEGLSALNILEGILREIRPAGDDQVDVLIDCGQTRLTARITAVSAEGLRLARDMPVYAVIKTVALDP